MRWLEILITALSSGALTTVLSLWITGQRENWRKADRLFLDLVMAWHKLMNAYDQMVLGSEGLIPQVRATPSYLNGVGDQIDALIPEVAALARMVRALDSDRARRECAAVLLKNSVLAEHVGNEVDVRAICGKMQEEGWRALDRVRPRRLVHDASIE